ncbi:MAG: beta-keto acid cleavage enzyme, partial [Thermoleophilia bacterium]|nr:beta-keto acid cleavage enzyme [Thermoleophilia bacterium]
GKLAESSRVQVERIRGAAEILHRKVASPAEARRRLALRTAS